MPHVPCAVVCFDPLAQDNSCVLRLDCLVPWTCKASYEEHTILSAQLERMRAPPTRELVDEGVESLHTGGLVQ